MAAISLAILGKNNEPLYIKEFSENDENSSPTERIAEDELFGLPKSVPPLFDTRRDQGSTGTGIGSGTGTGTGTGRRAGTTGIDCSIQQQFILHAALDRFEQLSGPPPGYAWRSQGVSGTDAMFVGLLAPVEDMRVYGYMTTTQIRFLLTVEDHTTLVGSDQRTVDEAIKRLLVKLHRIYVEYMLNPFCTVGPITSPNFNKKVQECVTAFNRSIAS